MLTGELENAFYHRLFLGPQYKSNILKIFFGIFMKALVHFVQVVAEQRKTYQPKGQF